MKKDLKELKSEERSQTRIRQESEAVDFKNELQKAIERIKKLE